MDHNEQQFPPVPVRDGRGYFLPGNKAAVGHRTAQQTMIAQLRQTFLEAVGTDRLREVIHHHLDLILQATPKEAAPLIELLYTYTMGKAPQHVSMDLTTQDVTPRPMPGVALDASDVSALERIRDKLNAPVIDVTPQEDDGTPRQGIGLSSRGG